GGVCTTLGGAWPGPFASSPFDGGVWVGPPLGGACPGPFASPTLPGGGADGGSGMSLPGGGGVALPAGSCVGSVVPPGPPPVVAATCACSAAISAVRASMTPFSAATIDSMFAAGAAPPPCTWVAPCAASAAGVPFAPATVP